jgi:hypothetical protein
MTNIFELNWRYLFYVLVAIIALAAYVALDDEPSGAPAVARRNAMANGALPTLGLFGDETARDARRNLFFPVKNDFGALQAFSVSAPPVEAAVESETASQKEDLFAGLRVIGFLRSARSATVLLALGPSLKTLAVGERFGARGALSVSSIEGREVRVVDNESKAVRSFVLSE